MYEKSLEKFKFENFLTFNRFLIASIANLVFLLLIHFFSQRHGLNFDATVLMCFVMSFVLPFWWADRSKENKLKLPTVTFVPIITLFFTMVAIAFGAGLLRYLGPGKLDFAFSIFEVNYDDKFRFLIAVAIVEEILMRGYLRRLFEKFKTPIALHMVLQGLLFSVGHWREGDLGAYAFYFSQGALLAILCIYYNSVFPGIALHLGWNIGVSLTSVFSKHADPSLQLFGLKYLSIQDISLSACMLVAAVMIFRKIRLRKS